MASRKPRTDYHHGELRAALLQATIATVRRSGPEGVTLRTVARVAGVSEAAPYHHFKDKNALLAAAAGEGMRMLEQHLAAEIDAIPRTKLAERAAAAAAGYVRFAFAEPGSFRLCFGAHVVDLAKDPAAHTPGRAARLRMTEPIEAFAAAHRLDWRVVFRDLWASAHGTAWLLLEHELGAPPRTSEAVEIAREAALRVLRGFLA